MLRLAVLLVLVPSAALAAPDTYRVVGVARGDMLNIRERPDPESDLIGQIPHDGRRIRGFGCTDDTENGTAWCRVKHGAVVGWVRQKFVRPE